MPDLYTFVAHQSLVYANPFSRETMERACDVLAAECFTDGEAAKVIDFGAGFCELPIRLAERFGCETVAVELGARMAATARERIRDRLLDRAHPAMRGGVTVHEGDAGRFRAQIPESAFDCSVCIGSSHALGGFPKTLDVLARLTKPHGCVLIGEGFWERTPAPSDLVGTPLTIDECVPLSGLFDGLATAGLRPLWSVSASTREWDEYEWAHHRALETFALARPDDPEAAKMLARGRRWRDGYVRGLRGLLGFCLILARRESST